MLIEFLNILKSKSLNYQLFWLQVLGEINNAKKSKVNVRKLKAKFNLSKTHYFDIMNFGLNYFNNPNQKGVYMKYDHNFIYIEVFRQKSLADIEKDNRSVENQSRLIIESFNFITGKKASHKTKDTARLIKSRIEDGFVLEDFKIVINKKNNEWKFNKTMKKYIRPQTLFTHKFERYLNEVISVNQKSKHDGGQRFKHTQGVVDKSKTIDWFKSE